MTISLSDTKMTTPHTVSEAALARYAETSSSDSVSGGFSGNFVLEFARMRLKHIDGWLESRLTTLKNNARATEELNELVAVLSKYSSGV
ncbi:MAG TPA: hypothetical protein VM580_14235, partial [Labilithrix sp.]|nr:hypothetical protein [Labilithrix sp.]